MTILTAAFLLAQTMTGQTIDRALPRPDKIGIPQQWGRFSSEFNKQMGLKDWDRFYAGVRPMIKFMNQLNRDQRDSLTKEDYLDRIWSFYLICAAPLYELDITLAEPWLHPDEQNDIRAKYAISSFIYTMDIDRASSAIGVASKDLKTLNSVYMASIVKTLRDAYIPGFDHHKEEELWKKSRELFKDDFDRMRYSQSRVTFQGLRNHGIKSILENPLEEDFVSLLVKYYPDKSIDVIKYIKLAGYADEEISQLIDRTVGRTEKTEYLYKGKIGREHDKRVKNRQKP